MNKTIIKCLENILNLLLIYLNEHTRQTHADKLKGTLLQLLILALTLTFALASKGAEADMAKLYMANREAPKYFVKQQKHIWIHITVIIMNLIRNMFH